MKPAVCCICGKSAVDNSSNKNGGWVEFRNYLEKESVGLLHPAGLEYFCGEHIAAALDFSNLDSEEALRKLKVAISCNNSDISFKSYNESWWRRLFK